MLRRAITDAVDRDALRRAAAQLIPALVALHEGGVDATRISAILSVLVDALTRRSIELSIAVLGSPPATLGWLALGSFGRHEAVPSSDFDSGMAWSAPAGSDTADYMHRLAGEVVDDLTSMGWEPDPHGVTATGVMSASSIGDWREAVHKWVEPPTSDEELVAISIVCDARTIYGPDRGLDVPSLIRDVHPQPALLRMLLRSALATKPPTGFLRDIVVEHSGEHKGHFDVKHGGLLPIVNIARYAALATRAMTTSTRRAPAGRGRGRNLTATDAATLGEAFDFISDLRLEHQIRRAPSGELARRPDRSEDAELSHAPLPSRHVPGRCLGAEVAERQARLEHLTVRGEPGARSILGAYDRTPMPAADTPWREADLCVVDLETTGLDAASDEIIAFATVPIAGARVCMREARYRVVCPRRMPRANTIVIHGLRSEELAERPQLERGDG